MVTTNRKQRDGYYGISPPPPPQKRPSNSGANVMGGVASRSSLLYQNTEFVWSKVIRSHQYCTIAQARMFAVFAFTETLCQIIILLTLYYSWVYNSFQRETVETVGTIAVCVNNE